LKKQKLFLGYEWLQAVDPDISWKWGTITIQNVSVPEPDYEEEFLKVFKEEYTYGLPPRRTFDHTIDLVEGSHPPKGRCYPLTSKERPAIKEFIKKNLKEGKIRHSKSEYVSSFFFRQKPNSDELRGIQDYWQLNEITRKDRYPLPLIQEIFNSLRDSTCFTKMDLRWGFNNVRIKPSHKHHAAFITSEGLFEPTVMEFGLCNAPSTFQRMMDTILKEELATEHVIVYIDDILVFTRTVEENWNLTRVVLRKLESAVGRLLSKRRLVKQSLKMRRGRVRDKLLTPLVNRGFDSGDLQPRTCLLIYTWDDSHA
jgi:hypothetical protein